MSSTKSKPIARGRGGPFGETMKRCGLVPARGRNRQQTGSLPIGQQEIITTSPGYFLPPYWRVVGAWCRGGRLVTHKVEVRFQAILFSGVCAD